MNRRAFVCGMILYGATDYAHLFVVDDELEKSMDVAALAGAGKLGFDNTAFPAVHAFAREFAERNAYRAKGSVGVAATGEATPRCLTDSAAVPRMLEGQTIRR